MALAETPIPELPTHRNAVELKAWVRSRLRELTAEIDGLDADAVADQLMLLMEGVYASAASLGDGTPARQARALAGSLVGAPEAPATVGIRRRPA